MMRFPRGALFCAVYALIVLVCFYPGSPNGLSVSQEEGVLPGIPVPIRCQCAIVWEREGGVLEAFTGNCEAARTIARDFYRIKGDESPVLWTKASQVCKRIEGVLDDAEKRTWKNV